MLRKFILLLVMSALVLSGFAQKSKKKQYAKAPKSSYFVMLINEKETLADRYCPNEMIKFDFTPIDTNILTYYWYQNFYDTLIYNITPIELAFPITADYPAISNYTITLYVTYTINSDTICDTLNHNINIDYIRTILDTSVCQGRDITVPTLKGDIEFKNVQEDCLTLWDTLFSASGCDSLVRWYIHMDPYITLTYEISSCDSVVWGDGTNTNTYPSKIVVRRPPDYEGDYILTDVERIFFATDPDNGCDTLKKLTVTIIDTGKIAINFDQEDFCSGEAMDGTFNLKTNFTAFDWVYFSRENLKRPDSLWTDTVKSFKIEEPGYYEVYAYMDTTLYEILTDLRIVATTCAMIADTIVEDCTLEIPNVFTPNGDNVNEVFGIKKLNLKRENELTIHDRWGKEVFRQKNYKCVFKNNEFHNIEDAFDGRSRGGQKLPEGTYYYALRYDAIPRNKAKTYVGVVVIVR